MRKTFFLSAALCALVACDSESSNVGANPSNLGTSGQAGAAQAGTGGQAQAGTGGQAQAGTGGQAQAGSGGQPEAGSGGQAAGGAGQGGAAGQAGSGGGAGKKFDSVTSDLPRDDGSAVGDGDRKAIVEGNNAFAFDLYERLRSDKDNAGKNLFFSPLSVTLALGMTSGGAKGATLDELAKAMHFSLPQEALHPALNWLSLELAKRPQQAKDFAKIGGAEAPPDVTFNIANAIWGEKTVTWQKPFLDTLARSYGTGINLGDFKKNADGERLIINEWVSEQTEKRINDLLPPGSLNGDSRIVLVNAMNFTFPWSIPFDKKNTKAAPFAVVGGSSVDIPTMANTIHSGYAEDDLAQSASISLFSDTMSLVVYVPKEGKFEEFESKLASEAAALKAKEVDAALDLKLPSFKFTSDSVSLRKALQDMGMNVPFSNKADFSGMTTTEPLYVSDVHHKAMLGLDEVGVQAAAATAVSLAGGGMPPPPKVLTVDRSFLVGIRDDSTGALLFFGRIIDPTKSGG